jgi:hypothetical protein
MVNVYLINIEPRSTQISHIANNLHGVSSVCKNAGTVLLKPRNKPPAGFYIIHCVLKSEAL